MRTENDRDLLTKLVTTYRDLLTEAQRDAFDDMDERLRGNVKRKLTFKQRRWAEKVLEEYEPSYENAISSGAAPLGRPVEMPAVLRRENLVFKPPGRK